jgi:antitoxin component of RelBE/YafQ-DinJ toxin-antitoxin module
MAAIRIDDGLKRRFKAACARRNLTMKMGATIAIRQLLDQWDREERLEAAFGKRRADEIHEAIRSVREEESDDQ